MKRRGWRLGPGLLVTAAFIGPGTVTTASLAGARYGFALFWAIPFSVAVTILLQEMAARLGLVTRQGLGQAISGTFASTCGRWISAALVILAIGFGNAAYQGGNILGAALGLGAISAISSGWWTLLVAITGGLLIFAGGYRQIERILVLMVGVMAVVFAATAFAVRPDPGNLVHGLVIPRVPAGSLTLVLALIGTTVVPYNLFLHASTVQEKWPEAEGVDTALSAARWDTVAAVMLGGVITLAVSVTAIPLFVHGIGISGPADMATQLQPLLGRFARYFFGVGLLAAGLTSAVTAPLAAGYAVCGVLGWQGSVRSPRFRLVSGLVLLTGVVYAMLGHKPVEAIMIAQAANGLLLPLIAVFLIIAANRERLMGAYRNRLALNLAAVIAVLVVIGLGVIQLGRLVGWTLT